MIMLPLPPSVNGLYAGKQRRYKSKAYKEWIWEAELMLTKQRPLPVFVGKIKARYSFGRPDKRKRDVANLEKAVSDLLVVWQVIQDDHLIEEITLRWDEDVTGAMVEIESFHDKEN